MKTRPIEEHAELIKIIGQCDVCFVGVADLDGTPYVVPMNFGFEKEHIYLHSANEGRIIDIISRNNKVSIAFNTGHELVYQHPDVACSYRMKSHSVVVSGHVIFEDDLLEKERVLHILMLNYIKDRTFTFSVPAIKNVKIWKVKIEGISGKQFAEPHK